MNTYSAVVRLRREGLGSARTHTVTVVLDAVSPDEAIVHAEALALATIKSLPLLWRVEESWLTDELVDARVTAELENARAQATADRAFQTDDTALRARVAELEKEAMILRGTVEAVTTQRQQAEQRVAELVAALDDLLGCPTVTDLATCPNGDPSRIDEAPEWQAVLQISCAWTRYKKLKALARAESAIQTKPVEEHISSREIIEGLQEDGL